MRRLLLPLLLALTAACGDKDTTDDSAAVDADGDGVVATEDCDDADAARFPGNAEVCDGVDNDCDGRIDIEPTDGLTLYLDVDNDGYGDPAHQQLACAARAGLVDNGDDCDDSSYGVSPAAQEYCDTIDNDCDGEVDEPDALGTSTWYADLDGDGFGDAANTTPGCTAPTGYTADTHDCDDADAAVNPDADELCDGVDNDCDGHADEADALDAPTWHRDLDGDGYGNPDSTTRACALPSGYVEDDTDCYDNDGAIHPGATETWYDGRDSSCHGGSDYDADLDGDDSDRWGGGDCDDSDPNVSSLLTDTWYDGTDSDCSGGSDYDADGDGEDHEDYGGTDCDDADPAINAAATEVWYDGVDADCDHWNDYDADFDWFESDSYGGGDCDDADAAVHPYAWEDDANGLDDDCDGTADVNGATDLALGDDDYTALALSSWTFDICGSSYSEVTVNANGLLIFEDLTSDSSLDWGDHSENNTEFREYMVNMSVLWDDLDPGTDGVVWVEDTGDALVVWWRDVPETGETTTNTFSVVLHSDGWIHTSYDAISSPDNLVGWSCGTDANATEVDLYDALHSRVSGSAGLGQGTEGAYFERFSNSTTDTNDLDGMALRFCAQMGADGDGDGWTADCGDPDDADATVTP
ncbi:MAG: hypothetical protein H6739_41680 [Alphaproteobacteria bacterium]|nr:hypothetical protein [Alphaproteobacteria bacterium]